MSYGSPMTNTKTGFDKYLAQRMKTPSFAKEYREERAEIDAIDQLVRALDEVRETKGLSKAALARAIGSKPEMVRRLMTAGDQNPTMRTMIRIATELGYHLALVPNRLPPASRRRHAAQRRAG